MVRKAEADFSSYFYRVAIQKVDPLGILPARVDRIKATARFGWEVKGFNSGIVVDATVWCFLSNEKRIPPITEASFPNKPAKARKNLLVAYVKNLHYPHETDLSAVAARAQMDLTSGHYRRAIQRIHPLGILPDKVDKVKVTARFGKDVKGFESGIVVDAEVWYYIKGK